MNISTVSVPHKLVHIGLVCRDLDKARNILSGSLGISWLGGVPETWELVIEGEARSVAMRISHSTEGSPRYELIESVAGTPWETDADVQLHHLCITAADPEELCNHLVSLGYRRILGKEEDSSGYFRQPQGLLVEVVDHNLLAYLNGFVAQRD